jgi:aconitate hydratase
LTGHETYDILNLENLLPNKELKVTITKQNGDRSEFSVIARLDSMIEKDYYKNNGILQFVLRNFLSRNKMKVV